MKKFLAMLLACSMVFAMTACGGSNNDATTDKNESTIHSSVADNANTDASSIKAGLICLHDENSTYDLNFLNAFKSACEDLGIAYEIKTNVPEGQECYNAACELVDAKCNIIFADSFGHEDYMIEAAKENPNVQFCHATGTKAHTEGLSNYHNAFASIYEGRYLAGVVAGMKLNEMIADGKITADQAKMGYIGAYTYAEVMSGYTSFFLGAKSICPSVTMEVTFTGSWYDETMEKEGANKLIQNGCVLISQHADSMGAPTACETAGVPNVSYNGSTAAACPNTFLVSSRIDWAPYYKYIVNAVKNGQAIPSDYTGTIQSGSVVLTELGSSVAAGTAEKVEEVKAALLAGTTNVFDTATFTVDGATLSEYMADVDTDAAYEGDHNVIIDGAFVESGDGFRSAPYFNLTIDGITLLDQKY